MTRPEHLPVVRERNRRHLRMYQHRPRPWRRSDALSVPYPSSAVRPVQRADCELGPRPCPWVSCRHHLYLDVTRRRTVVQLNFPGAEIAELPATCALDVAQLGGLTEQEVGTAMNLTRERVRQLANAACKKLERRMEGHR